MGLKELCQKGARDERPKGKAIKINTAKGGRNFFLKNADTYFHHTYNR